MDKKTLKLFGSCAAILSTDGVGDLSVFICWAGNHQVLPLIFSSMFFNLSKFPPRTLKNLLRSSEKPMFSFIYRTPNPPFLQTQACNYVDVYLSYFCVARVSLKMKFAKTCVQRPPFYFRISYIHVYSNTWSWLAMVDSEC